MPWIKVFSLEEAAGLLRKEYEAALKRAGRLWHIVTIMWSQWNPFAWVGDRSYGGLRAANNRSSVS